MSDARTRFSTTLAASCVKLGGSLLTNRGKLGAWYLAQRGFYTFCRPPARRLWHSLADSFKQAEEVLIPVAAEFYPLSPGLMATTTVFSKGGNT